MTSIDDPGRIFLRNKLLGRWTAEKLGMAGQDAEDYSDALAWAAFDPERSDVFRIVRRDFDAAGVAQTDQQIREVMTECLIKAGKVMSKGTEDSVRGAEVILARKLIL
ncbi:ATPase inhibitor subunit zeta [Methylobacterium sp. CM6257]